MGRWTSRDPKSRVPFCWECGKRLRVARPTTRPCSEETGEYEPFEPFLRRQMDCVRRALAVSLGLSPEADKTGIDGAICRGPKVPA
jgi:hypothetical protein